MGVQVFGVQVFVSFVTKFYNLSTENRTPEHLNTKHLYCSLFIETEISLPQVPGSKFTGRHSVLYNGAVVN